MNVKSLMKKAIGAGGAGAMNKRILVAGVGNVFMQDDGFGPEVVKRLLLRPAREDVVVKDFGTGGFKLAYDLMPGYDALILVDAVKRGEPPGTLYVIEPTPDDIPHENAGGGLIDPHGADVSAVLRFVNTLNARPPTTLLIGCEVSRVDGAGMGLSEPVRAAVDRAVAIVEAKIEELANAVLKLES